MRRLEKPKVAKKNTSSPQQLTLFDSLGLSAPKPVSQKKKQVVEEWDSPRWDACLDLLNDPLVLGLDDRRKEALLDLERKHRRIVFLSEHVSVLTHFAGMSGQDHPQRELFLTMSGLNKKDLCDLKQKISGSRVKFISKSSDIEGFLSDRSGNRLPERFSVFMTYHMAEGVNIQSCDTIVCLGATSNLTHLIQGLGRIDRIDSPHNELNVHLLDFPIGCFASDLEFQNRLRNLCLMNNISNLPEVLSRDDAPKDFDTSKHVENFVSFLNASRGFRFGNFHDVLESMREKVDQEVLRVQASRRMSGLWGAQLACLNNDRQQVFLHFGSLVPEKASPIKHISPPRLLCFEPSNVSGSDFSIERSQARCAFDLSKAYDKTLLSGQHKVLTDFEGVEKWLSDLQIIVSSLQEWDLRPERMDVLFEQASLLFDVFGEKKTPKEWFGDLSLVGLEVVFETWLRSLAPYWNKLKEENEVRRQNGDPLGLCVAEEALKIMLEDTMAARSAVDVLHSTLDAVRRNDDMRKRSVSSLISVVFLSG